MTKILLSKEVIGKEGIMALMSPKKLSEKEATKIILSILEKADEPLSTRDIEGETRKLLITCPDNTPVFLNKLRLKGIIKGQLSPEKRGWIWWIKEKEN